MIEWARQRVRGAGVEDRVELVVAEVNHLPFDNDRFDVVVSESVLAFVDDKRRAIDELVRVTKPGGYVGLNEGVWVGELPEDVARVARDLGTEVLSVKDWRTVWDGSGLRDRVVKVRKVDPDVEIRSRIRWIGLGWLVRAWGRAAYLLLTRPAIRGGVKTVVGGGRSLDYVAYGLFVGRK
jgi:SAM-dependent methyltransferase